MATELNLSASQFIVLAYHFNACPNCFMAFKKELLSKARYRIRRHLTDNTTRNVGTRYGARIFNPTTSITTRKGACYD